MVNNFVMASFDVESLFTNVPVIEASLREVNSICYNLVVPATRSSCNLSLNKTGLYLPKELFFEADNIFLLV